MRKRLLKVLITLLLTMAFAVICAVFFPIYAS